MPLKFDAKTERYSSIEWLLPPVQLTTDEALTLFGLADEFGRQNKLPFYGAASNAARKIEQTLPKPLRREVAPRARAIEIQSVQLNETVGKKAYFGQLIEAIVRKTAVDLVYESLTECETIETQLQPYRLLFSQHSWYVLGRSSMHREVRTFNIDRIASLVPLRKKFVVPKSFSLEKHFRNAWHMIPANGPDSHVVVRFSSFVARNVAEVRWHKTQRTEQLADGSLEFRAIVSGLNEICWWILRYGDQAEVLQPARLRRMIAQRVQNMAAIYKESG